MKITVLQIHESFGRAVAGESVRAIARSLRVTEGCPRVHFRKSTSPKEIRRLAYEMFHAQQLYSNLAIREKSEVGRRMKKALGRERSTWLESVIERTPGCVNGLFFWRLRLTELAGYSAQ